MSELNDDLRIRKLHVNLTCGTLAISTSISKRDTAVFLNHRRGEQPHVHQLDDLRISHVIFRDAVDVNLQHQVTHPHRHGVRIIPPDALQCGLRILLDISDQRQTIERIAE